MVLFTYGMSSAQHIFPVQNKKQKNYCYPTTWPVIKRSPNKMEKISTATDKTIANILNVDDEYRVMSNAGHCFTCEIAGS